MSWHFLVQLVKLKLLCYSWLMDGSHYLLCRNELWNTWAHALIRSTLLVIYCSWLLLNWSTRWESSLFRTWMCTVYTCPVKCPCKTFSLVLLCPCCGGGLLYMVISQCLLVYRCVNTNIYVYIILICRCAMLTLPRDHALFDVSTTCWILLRLRCDMKQPVLWLLCRLHPLQSR